MNHYDIAVIPGDGTGPEVVREGLKVLKAASERAGFSYALTEYDFGAERYLRTGETLPDSAIDELRGFNAIYLGAIGHPDVKPGILEHGILLNARFALDLYINLRPVKLFPNVETPLKDKGPADIDFVVVRENTEGLYAGTGGSLRKGTPDEIAVQESVNTRMGVERCLRYAFDYASRPDRQQRLTLCGKTNVLTFAWDLWWRAFNEIGDADYQHIQRDYAHVDAIVMWFVKNPEWFDVIVTDNMFGDIITDLAAMIQGGLGIAAGGNLRPGEIGMFEPMGGSAPKYQGQNVINPLAAIASLQMMLDFLGEKDAARWVEAAIVHAVSKMPSLAAGKMGMTTSEVGDLVAQYVSEGQVTEGAGW
jgi:3-isopropylmalate dehydrogenase